MSPLVTFADMKNIGTIAKGYLWDLLIPALPSGVKTPGGVNSLKFRCRSTELPTRDFAAIVDTYQGLETVDTGAPTYTHELPMTLTEVTEGWIIPLIESWLDLSYDPNGGAGGGVARNKSDRVIPTMGMRMLDNHGTPYVTYNLINAQPKKNPGGTPLSYENKEGKIEMQITWLYDYYQMG